MLVSTYHVSDESRTNARRQWVEARPLVIGSASDCDVVVEDPEVAPRHLRLDVRDRAIVVETLTGAAEVDGTLLGAHQSMVVDEGRPIRIGGTIVKVRMQTAAVVATTPVRGSNPEVRDANPPGRPPPYPRNPPAPVPPPDLYANLPIGNPPPPSYLLAPSPTLPTRPPTPARPRKTTLSEDPTEQRLLEVLRANPGEHETRLVLADYLEQRGQIAKAELVRLREHLDTRVHKAAGEIEWRAVAVRTPIEHCILNRCPKYWDALAPGPDDFTRQCTTCDKQVMFCGELVEVRAAAFDGRPCVFDAGLDRVAAHEAYRKFGEQPVSQVGDDEDDLPDDDPDGYTVDTSSDQR